MFCLSRRSCIPEPVKNFCSKGDESGSASSEYLFFWQQFETCGDCRLLLTVLSVPEHVTRPFWWFKKISQKSRYCELSKWESCSPSWAFSRSFYLLITTALPFSSPWALLVAIQFISNQAYMQSSSPSLCTSCIFSVFCTRRVSLVIIRFFNAYCLAHFMWSKLRALRSLSLTSSFCLSGSSLSYFLAPLISQTTASAGRGTFGDLHHTAKHF